MEPNQVELHVNQEPYIFSFDRVLGQHTEKYFVSGKAPSGKAVHFEMRKNSKGSWQVAFPAPDWIIRIETLLVGALHGQMN